MTNTDNLDGLAQPLAAAITFIWREAEILDRKDYAAWSALWDPAGIYVVPIDPDTTDFSASLNYVYDDARMRKLRIERLSSGFSMSAVEASNTVRTVSRFTLVSHTDDLVEVNSAQVLIGFRRGTHTIFAANLTHKIRLLPDGPKLEQKVVRLINSTDSLSALGFLL